MALALFALLSSALLLVSKTDFWATGFSVVVSPRCSVNRAEVASQWGRTTCASGCMQCCRLFAKKSDSPYGDFDYTNYTPEFVDYSNPDYIVDQGLVEGEEMGANGITDEEILEEMREERRKRNDEYQFQTYFATVWQNGAEFKGEWTVYGTTAFINNDSVNTKEEEEYPGLVKAKRVARVISSASKELVRPDAKWRGDREVIRHVEYEVTNEANEATLTSIRDVDTDSGFGRHNNNNNNNGFDADLSTAATRTPLSMRYWPQEMTSFDFRGQQGNMCVGVAYTVCDAVKLNNDNNGADDGPFLELRSEIGIIEDSLRMRVKFDYGILSSSSNTAKDPPPLHLKTITVCRERLEEWPCNRRDAQLFTSVGANGGLYDPPPVGCDKQASRYMSIDVEGGASILCPYLIDQTTSTLKDGWVLSLDWTPGSIRYQVDRKFLPGEKIKGLRTLELSEVQALEADTYRPKDAEHMRQ